MSTACRFCKSSSLKSFLDLGMSPQSNDLLKEEDLKKPEVFYPLHPHVCSECKLVQLDEFLTPESIFSDYVYFSSYSESWLKHALDYTNKMVDEYGITKSKLVIEIASNDGYLLQYFKEKEIPVLGIEPAKNVGIKAIEAGIETRHDFFSEEFATRLINEGIKADLLLGNNVLAHVPNLNDFVKGLKILLSDNGFITLEFPHLLELVKFNQFDTIYHEHFSYFSFYTVEQVLKTHGLKVFNLEKLATHGGSLRLYACHADNTTYQTTSNIAEVRNEESTAGIHEMVYYENFSTHIAELKRNLLDILIELKRQNKTVVGYGAAAKGNTLLNYCGIRTDLIDYIVDKNPIKQNKYTPGTHIPIFSDKRIIETKPDAILILPWNLKDEITSQLDYVKEWGCQFIVPVPHPAVL